MVRRTRAAAAATRRDLMDAAFEAFGECGYTGATLEQIAARAGVTRGALYHHFVDKTDVYEAVLRREADGVTGALLAGLESDAPPLQRLHGFVVGYCTALAEDARFRRALELLLFGSPDAPPQARARTRRGYEAWLHAFERVLAEALDRGELRSGITPRAAAHAVVAMTAGATTAAMHAPGSASPADHAEALADTLVAGLST